jgi:hypothetical protein
MKTTVSVVALCLASSLAHADSKAWNAAKNVVPAHEMAVIGINFASARSSMLYQAFVPMMLSRAGDAATKKLNDLKAACGVDPLNAVDSIVFAVDDKEDVTAVVALNGLTQSKLESCLTTFSKTEKKNFEISKDGPLTKYVADTDTTYVRWLGADTFAIAIKKDQKSNKDDTLAGTGGGIAGDHALRGLGTVNTSATLWGVASKSSPLPTGGSLTGGYGSANVAAGAISVDLHVGTDSAATAAANVKQGQTQLDGMKGSAPFADLVKSVKLSAVGNDIVVQASVPEKAIMSLAQMALGGMGGH